MVRIKLIPLVVATLLLITLVLGCAAPKTTAPIPATTGGSSTSGPKYGGTLRISYAKAPPTMDPVIGADGVSAAFAKLWSACLVHWSGKSFEEAKIVGWLAKSFEVSPDGLIWTFKLNQGVKFQNIPPVNGREMTADDVKYSFDRILDPKTRTQARSFFLSIDRIEAPDKYTVKFFLKNPDPAILVNLAAGASTIVPRELIEAEGNTAKKWIGVGAFIMKEYSPASGKAVLVRNPDYFEKGKPYLDGIEIFHMVEDASMLAAFRSSNLDQMQTTITNAELAKKTTPGLVMVPGVDSRGVAIHVGQGKNPKMFGDKRVRLAIAYAIDYDGLIKAALDGAGYRTDLLGPLFKDIGARTGKDLPQRDVAKAKALLAEAGQSKIVTELLTESTKDTFALAEPIVAMLKDVGIEVTIKVGERADTMALCRAGDIELAIASATLEKPDADINITQLYSTSGSQNFGRYSNPEVDSLIELQRKDSAVPQKRNEHLRKLMSILIQDQPLVPLSIRYLCHVQYPHVRDWNNLYEGHPQQYWFDLRNVWLDK